MDTTEITKYLNIARRRKYWMIIPFLATILAGLGYALNTPKIYQAQTVILVQPQSVPKDLVRTIVAENLDERVRTIYQQVASRTNLEKIIRDYGLVSEMDRPQSLDALVVAVRERLKIEVVRGGGGHGSNIAFSISFRGKDPQKVMQVTNALASNFISQNLESREIKVMGTSSFLAEELESVRKRLSEKEEELKSYRELYMGGLPDQLNANLASLQRLQMHADQLNSNLRDAENRKLVIQQSIEDARRGRLALVPPTAQSAQGLEARDPATLRNELAALEARYTPNHPDVVRLKKTIESLEGSGVRAGSAADPPPRVPVVSAAEQSLAQQLRDVEVGISGVREEIKKVQAEINVYKRRVEDTPKREQELFSIERDYNNQKNLYNSLLQRKLEADIAVSMERKQKGEQFRVLDPAKAPTHPVEPDMKRMLLMVLALSFGLGGGMAYLREMLDTSYKAPEEIEKELDMKILVSIPFRYTEAEVKKKKTKEVFKAASVGFGFAVSAVAIIMATKGFDKTLDYVKTLVGLT
jgi:polysaccharide chain length determinant protein (PEP-CTERM system associated)